MDMIVFQFGKDKQYYRQQKFVTVTESQCRRHKAFAPLNTALLGTAVGVLMDINIVYLKHVFLRPCRLCQRIIRNEIIVRVIGKLCIKLNCMQYNINTDTSCTIGAE